MSATKAKYSGLYYRVKNKKASGADVARKTPRQNARCRGVFRGMCPMGELEGLQRSVGSSQSETAVTFP